MLEEYNRKRNFEVTPEPGPTSFAAPSSHLRFVVQWHDATNLHYDLRIESQGVLKSWALPKGPTCSTDDKRFAVQVEDHPLAYGDFEGAIPKGEYGGGDVRIWDQGDYYVEREDGTLIEDLGEAEAEVAKGIADGKLSVLFKGYRLRGSYALVRMKKANEWLFLKHKDKFALNNFDIRELTGSVLSPPAVVAEYVAPMLLQEGIKPPSGEHWQYEVKLDGVRVIAAKNRHEVNLFSRNGANITDRFWPIAKAVRDLPGDTLLLDGEIIYFDAEGKPSFQTLMEVFQRTQPSRMTNVEFCIFDLLQFHYQNCMGLPLAQRRAMLERIAPFHHPLRLVDTLGSDGPLAVEIGKQFGFEGVVAKDLRGKYRPGKRVDDWQKFKEYHSGEFVIIGWAEGDGAREGTLGSLAIASVNDGELKSVGDVGTGFDDATLRAIYEKLIPLERENPIVSHEGSRPKRMHWVEPKEWVTVRYQQMSPSGHLRIPVFVRMRPDMTAPDVVGESSMVDELVAQLAQPRSEVNLEYRDFKLTATKLDKEIWPEVNGQPAVTKRDLLRYMMRSWRFAQRHLRDRPLTLVRHPDGIDTAPVYQKHWQHEPPSFVEQVRLWSETNGEPVPFTLAQNLETWVWLAQMGIREIHAWYSRVSPEPGKSRDFASSEDALDRSILGYPDFVVFDLDPPKTGPTPDRSLVIESAFALRETLQSIGLDGFIKSTGKSGLHVYLPILRNIDYAGSKQVAQFLGQHLANQHPHLFTIEWAKDKRPHKVYFDYNQNGRGRTLISAYSPRAAQGGTISMPIEWNDLRDWSPSLHTIHRFLTSPPERDPWEGIGAAPFDLLSVLGLS